MPADASIYGQIQPVRPRNALADFADVMQIQGLQQRAQLNQMQMDEARRARSQEEALAGAYRNALAPDGTINRNALFSGVAGAGLGHKLPGIQKGFADSDKAAAEAKGKLLENTKRRVELSGQAFGFVRSAPTLENANSALNFLEQNEILDAPTAAKYRQQITTDPSSIPALAEQAFRAALDAKEQLAKIETRDTGGAVQTLATDPVTMRQTVLGTVAKTATPGDLLTDRRVREEGALNRSVTIRGQDKVDARAKDANAIQSGQKTQQGVQDLRKEFNGLTEVKNYKEVLPIIQSVQRAPDTPAGDIDLIYGVGKIMDPNSVVREGEMTIVIKSGSPAQRLQGFANYVKGGGRLSPTQRQELLAVMESRVAGLKSNYDAARATYENAADKQGLPKDQIFIESPQTKPAATPSGAGALSPEEQKELEALRARFGKGK